ncbi:MAG: RodZ domain-containing protein [Candidatus Omnitrophota bacterium]
MEPAGAKLKKIRQELGLSLEEIQKKTKIHLNILKAIEGDSLTSLNPIYLRSFLKIYCKFLGVDPQDYLADYKEGQSQHSSVPVAKDLKPAVEKFDFLKTTGKKYKRVLVLISVIVILAFGLYNLGKVISSKRWTRSPKAVPVSAAVAGKREDKKEIKVKKAGVTRPAAAVQAAPVPAARNTAVKKDAGSGIRLGIRARENCWVDMKADGRVVFRRVLEKGRFETWQAKDKIELSLGNAGAVDLEVNGQHFSNLGRRGQALKGIVITKDGLKVGR